MIKLPLVLMAVLLFSMPILADPDCAVDFTAETYSSGSAIAADMVCDSGTESSKDYSLTWRDENGTILEIDTGTTPPGTGTHFFNILIIPEDYIGQINATLTGTNLEGFDVANVTSAGPNELKLQDIRITPNASIYIGRPLSVHARLTDENDKGIHGAICQIEIFNQLGVLQTHAQALNVAGHIATHFNLGSEDGFESGKLYGVQLHCGCGLANTSAACINEDGEQVANSMGSSLIAFPIINTETKEGGGEPMIALILMAVAFFLMYSRLNMEDPTGWFSQLTQFLAFSLITGSFVVARESADLANMSRSVWVLDGLVVVTGLLTFLYLALVIYSLILYLKESVEKM